MNLDILLAILLGTGFGFVMFRAGVANPENIKAMLSFQNTQMLRIIMLALGISLIGVFTLSTLMPGVINFSVKTANYGVIAGGLIFGAGFALGGYCPGTCLVASGAGRKDALFFVLGGLFGALIFSLIFSRISASALFEKIGSGKLTLAETGASDALLTSVPALIPGVLLGIAMILIARKVKDQY